MKEGEKYEKRVCSGGEPNRAGGGTAYGNLGRLITSPSLLVTVTHHSDDDPGADTTSVCCGHHKLSEVAIN